MAKFHGEITIRYGVKLCLIDFSDVNYCDSTHDNIVSTLVIINGINQNITKINILEDVSHEKIPSAWVIGFTTFVITTFPQPVI